MAKSTTKNESVFPLAEKIRQRGEDITPKALKKFEKDMSRLNAENNSKLK
jgi:hypothetical protein